MKKAQISQGIVKIFIIVIVLAVLIIGGKVIVSMFNQNDSVQTLDFKQTLDEYISSASNANLGSVSYHKMPGFKDLKYVCFVDRTIDSITSTKKNNCDLIKDNYLVDFVNSQDDFESTLLITSNGHEPIDFKNIKLKNCMYTCIKPGSDFSLTSESSGIYITNLE